MMQLYYAELLAPRKACAVARYLGSDVDFVRLDVTRGEQKAPGYLAINPNGTLPALTDGDRKLWEADAIMCHLSDRAGAGLWPHDDRQVEVIRWLSWNAMHFIRCGGSLYFEYVVRPMFGLGEPDAADVQTATADFRRYGAVLDDHLRDRTWLVGGSVTVADFSVAIALPYADRAPMPLDAFPAIRRWHDRLCNFDAWRNPFPERSS